MSPTSLLRKALVAATHVNLHALGILLREGPSGFGGALSAMALAAAPTAPRTVSAWTLVRALPHDESLIIAGGGYYDGSISPLERCVIAHLVRRFTPKTVVEIGTYRGATTRLMLDNLEPDARIWTVDLPLDVRAEEVPHASQPHLIRNREVGEDFKDHPRRSQVVQVLGDSLAEATWRQMPWDIDFAFIDGSHTYVAVKSDTERIRQRLREGGVLIWHDYLPGDHPGHEVGRYLRERLREWPDLVFIEGTRLAVRLSRALLGQGAETLRTFFPAGGAPDPFPWLSGQRRDRPA